jgi:hypothetical protein
MSIGLPKIAEYTERYVGFCYALTKEEEMSSIAASILHVCRLYALIRTAYQNQRNTKIISSVKNFYQRIEKNPQKQALQETLEAYLRNVLYLLRERNSQNHTRNKLPSAWWPILFFNLPQPSV